MLKIAIIFFIITGIIGLYILYNILKNNDTPKKIAIVHGSLGLIGLLLAIGSLSQISGSAPFLGIFLMIIALVGGFILFSLDMKGKRLPKGIIILHPLIALLGIIALLYFILH